MTEPTRWKPAGLNGQPTAAELTARHTGREPLAGTSVPNRGLPLPGVPGPSGIRVASGGDWRERCRARGKTDWSQEL
jgi:hypothetical protein